jgi:CelD/BcsL family acetyltransferase involved in cellulose biosynthesis
MVSLDVKGKTVAVDVGAEFGGTYTVFLGGTDAEHSGVAKVMNMHHLERACKGKIDKVDFLCGDFHWKKLWHLDPEPLYQFITFYLDSDASLHSNLSMADFSIGEGLANA